MTMRRIARPRGVDRRTVLAGFLGLALSGRPAVAAADGAELAEAISALRGGGHVVAFRHAATTRGGIDRIEWPRHRQRLLSAEGIADSRAIGEAFGTLGIPVGEVLASPFARCADMARLAFGRVETRADLLGLLSDREGRAARIAALEELMADPPSDGTNRVVVTHTSNVRAVTGITLGEGDGVVARPRGETHTLLATLTPDDWRRAAAP